MSDQATTWPEHDCKGDVWHNSAEYRYVSCMICRRIIRFRFKSPWKHLKQLLWDGIR